MAKSRVTATLLVGLGSLAGIVLWRRRAEREREHVDLYFADGSMVSLAEGSAESARLLDIARTALAAAR